MNWTRGIHWPRQSDTEEALPRKKKAKNSLHYHPETESCFVDCIERKIYLSPLDLSACSTLIGHLRTLLSSDIAPKFTDTTCLITGGRPFFIQNICGYIVETDKSAWTSDDFSENFTEDVFQIFFCDGSHRAIIDTIVGQEATLPADIIAYIAHYPGSNIRQLKIALESYRDHEIDDAIDAMCRQEKIKCVDGEFEVNGLLFQEWVRRRRENPIVTYGRAKINSEFTAIGRFVHGPVLSPACESDFISVVKRLIDEFRHYVEQKKGTRLLWYDDDPAPEENAQILFDLLSDRFAQFSDISINREIETGRGPVDFKFAKGYHNKIHLEVKRATSSKLQHGLKKTIANIFSR